MATSIAAPSAQLGQDQFMKLLLAQVRSQDPLDPIKDNEFVSQLSQFSVQSGIEKLNTNFADMLALQQLSQGANLAGKTIVFDQPNSSTLGHGVVQSVSVQGGKIQVFVNGATVPLNKIRGFLQPPT